MREWVDDDDVRRFVADIVRRFDPDKIILFGSRGDGTARSDSDVDLLVVMDFEGRPVEQAVAIRREVECPFPLDLLVRRPDVVRERIADGDSFLRGIMEHGKVLHERP